MMRKTQKPTHPQRIRLLVSDFDGKMIKTVINKFIKAALDELFVDAPSVNLSMGADMFSDSNINLTNLTFRPDIFDVYAQPFRLISGHVGQLCAEGIAELALGGKLKFQVDNVCLLFGLDTVADPEKIQTMKKILLELQAAKFSSELLLDLLRRVQGLGPVSEVDLSKKRKVVYKALDYISKGVFITIKNIHVRFEFMNEDGRCDALGLRLPLVKINPGAAAMRPDGMSRQDPLLSIQSRSAQVYCDYNRVSYDGGDAARTKSNFEKYVKAGLHTSLIVPFDIDIILGLDIKRRTGLVCPKVSVHVPAVRCCVDKDQVAALTRMASATMKAQKKFQQAVKVQKIFRVGFPLPRMYQVVGVRCLPHLLVHNDQYPRAVSLADTALPGPGGLVAFMKNRVGQRWALMLWKHLYRLIIHDVRLVRPLGRWKEIARLSALRREYVFAYAKLLTKSNTEAAHFMLNVNAPISQNKLRDLFEIEMQLPLEAVSMFRSLAYMVAIVSSLNAAKRKTGGKEGGGWEATFISWADILRIYVELHEAKRESSFHRFDRNEGGNDDDYDDHYSVMDDSQSNKNSDEGTVFSYSLQGRTPAKASGRPLSQSTTSTSKTTPVSATNANTKSFFGGFGFGGGGKDKDGNGGTSPAGDDYDNKVMKKFDLSVFGSALGAFVVKADKAQKEGTVDTSTHAAVHVDAEALLRRSAPPGGCTFPDLGVIAEAAQWAIQRFQNSLTIMPPDLSVKLDKCSVEIKTPLMTVRNASGGVDNSYDEPRMSLLSANLLNTQLTLNISQSSSNDLPQSKASVSSPAQGARAFDYLSGALIQLKIVVGQCACTLAVPPMLNAAAALSPARRKNRTADDSSDRGSVLTSGLPVYPVGQLSEDDRASEASSSVPEVGAPPSTPPTSSGRNPDGTAWKSIPGVANPKVKYLPGKTLLESMQEAQEEVEEEEVINRQRAESNEAIKQKGLNIESPMDDMNLSTGVSIYEDIRYVQKDFLSSSPGDQMLIVCVILDLDNKGEGAGDAQCHLGSARLDLSNTVLATLLSPLLRQTLQDLALHGSQLNGHLGLMGEPMVLIDWACCLPLVKVVYTKMRFVEELDEVDGEPDDTAMEDYYNAMQNRQEEGAGDDHSDASGGPPSYHPPVGKVSAASREIEPEEEEQFTAFQRSLLLHRNVTQWLSLLNAYLPKVLSVSFCINTILIQSLEANIVRDLIHARLHTVMDK